MSKGLGRIQRECLRVIKACEAAGKRPTTFTVTVEVYRVEPAENGDRLCNDAQHTATKRALANLRRKGLIAGQPDITVYPNGKRIFTYVRVGGRTVLPLVNRGSGAGR
jgi:hypothetical protein